MPHLRLYTSPAHSLKFAACTSSTWMAPGGILLLGCVCNTQSEPDDSCRKQLLGWLLLVLLLLLLLVCKASAVFAGRPAAAAAAAVWSCSSCCRLLGWIYKGSIKAMMMVLIMMELLRQGKCYKARHCEQRPPTNHGGCGRQAHPSAVSSMPIAAAV
jgi:hypothetical protein